MAPTTRTPRNRWIEEGLRALAAGGPDAVRIESLARALGVSKGGFYWHFNDRRALLEEMLDAWEHTWVDEVIEAVEDEDGDARSRLRRLFALAAASGGELLKIELAIRDWARREEAVAKRLRQVDNRRMDYMRSLFGAICEDDDDVEARCLLAFSLFIGGPFITVDHGGRSRAEVVELALERLTRRSSADEPRHLAGSGVGGPFVFHEGCGAMGPSDVTFPASKTRINRPARCLSHGSGEKPSRSRVSRKPRAVRAYRAVHAYPLKSVTMGLRHHARKAAGDSWLDISQRLEQLPTITDKLVRMPKTNLARIQDIGGSGRHSSISRSSKAIALTENRAARGSSWHIVDIDDYVNERTRHDGYRAKHVIVRKHGLQIEMQFRTSAQHNWAEFVESLDAGGKYEVVLVGADSIETIKRTHSPYFSTGTATEVVEAFIASIR